MPDRAITPGQSANKADCPFFICQQADLTQREVEALELAAIGQTDAEIGLNMCITPRTVAAHLQNAYAKLGARSRAHAVAIALVRQLIEFNIGTT